MSIRWRTLGAPAIALLAIASSAIGIVNQFTYDDKYVILLNPATHTLHAWWRAFSSSYWPKEWGGDGYRPLTILAFKIESALGNGSPAAFHAANILLYACTALAVFVLAKRMLPLWAAWIAAAVFAVHPVHVEAVANVVGQSELLVAIAVLSATTLYLRDRQSGWLTPKTTAYIAALYLLGCLAKEHAIVLPGVLFAAELTILNDAPLGEKIRRLRPSYLVLVAVAVAFVGLRAAVLSDHGIGGFQPFTPFAALHISTRDRILTALGVVPQWVRLLFWPAHLSSEYGPADIDIAQGFSISQFPGFALLIAILGLGHLLRRRQPVIGFGIALIVVALLPSSNFIIPAGIVLAERTLFLPSVGAVLIVGALAVVGMNWFAARHLDRPDTRLAARGAVALVLLTGALRSAQRSTVWRDNDTLFRHAVIDSPLSYRAHYMLGAWHFENKRKRLGEAEYRIALRLFPYDPFLAYNMAEQYRNVGMCGPALPLYRWTRGLDPQFPLGRTSFAMCLLNEGDYDEAKKTALDAMRVGGDMKALRRIVFIADSAKSAEHRGKAN